MHDVYSGISEVLSCENRCHESQVAVKQYALFTVTKVYKAHMHTHTLTVTLRTSTVPINASQNANTLQNTNSKETKNRNIPPTCQYDQTYWNEQATCPHLQHTVRCGHTNLTHSIKYQGAANALYLNSGRSCNIHPIMHQVRCTICRTDLLCNPSFNMATHTHTHGQDW